MLVRTVLISVATLALAAPDVLGAKAPLNIYEWIRPAPFVVAARVDVRDGRHRLIEIVHTIRGDVEPGTMVRVRVRKANVERPEEMESVKVEEGDLYFVLLQEVAVKDPDQLRTFELVRGTRGVREVPAEGWEPIVEAATLFAQIQDADDLDLAWHRFEMMIEETNPHLIEVALLQHMRYLRGKPEHLPLVRPLFDHPRPAIRILALRLSGSILERFPGDAVSEREEIQTEIIGLARSDPAMDVRIAATRALAALRQPGIKLVVEDISRDDPEQEVRYAAERVLYDWARQDEAGEGG